MNLFYKFNEWCWNNTLDTKSQVMFSKLIYLAYKNGLNQWFEISNSKLMDVSMIQNETSFKRSRQKLIELGFIEYTKGKKGQFGKYKIKLERFGEEKVQPKEQIDICEKTEPKIEIDVRKNVEESETAEEKEEVIETDMKTDKNFDKEADKKAKELQKKKEKEAHLKEMFDMFWAKYPKKQSKKRAFISFKNIKKLNDTLFNEILESVDRFKKTDNWQKDNGLYVPMASTFLNGERWKDEVKVTNQVWYDESTRVEDWI